MQTSYQISRSSRGLSQIQEEILMYIKCRSEEHKTVKTWKERRKVEIVVNKSVRLLKEMEKG